jgi:DNA-binding NtrC family response regulator
VPVLSASAPLLIGSSPQIEKIRRAVLKIGPTNAPVLLQGETGTGKEVVARAIHSVATAGPFVAIDCSTVGALLESELFGHTKGAFTGAVASKTGLLELADGGTAFLDEIGELPLELQAKLLRVLQEKEVRPLGALSPRRTNFRVIAATNRDLAAEVGRGAFRSDLYYRLNVIKLRLPPLRERREDIPHLVHHFLRMYGNGQTLSASLLQTLSDYDWPGNVRELENCVQRMCAMNSGPVLDIPDLPSALAGWTAASSPQPSPAPSEVPVPVFAGTGPVRARVLPLEHMERQAILDALEFTRGDRARAASLLGIGRTTLYRKLKRYEIEI